MQYSSFFDTYILNLAIYFYFACQSQQSIKSAELAINNVYQTDLNEIVFIQ